MKLNSKTILTIGAGAVVGYFIFCKFMNKGMQKSLEGAPSEDSGLGGGGGGGGFGGGGGSVSPLPPIVAPIVPPGYVVVGANTITSRDNLAINPNTGTNSTFGTPVTTQPTRDIPAHAPAPATKPAVDVSGAPVSTVPTTTKFTDFDGVDFDPVMNQDALL
jgi:hypothetical protein